MANPLNTVADYAQSLLSSQRSQQLQESFVNFLKSMRDDAPAPPRGDIIGAQPPQPGTIEQLFPQRPPFKLPPTDIAAPNPGGGMVPQSVLENIQSRPPEVPAPQGVWDPAIEAIRRRGVEEAKRAAEEAQRVLRGEQQLSDIAASAAAEREAARAAKDAPGYVDGLLSRIGLGRKAPSPPVQVAPPEGYDEALEAAKFREQQLISGRTDNLRGQDKALNDFKRGLIDERNEKAALEYVKKADAMERQQRLSDQMKSGVEGLKTAAPMVGALGAAVTVPAVVAGMANTPSPMAPTRREPATTADLASTVPSIEATPDEQPPQAPVPQAPAQQPSYMGQNPGSQPKQPLTINDMMALAYANPGAVSPEDRAKFEAYKAREEAASKAKLDEGLKFFGADTRPEITPEQREKAKQDFEAQNQRNLDSERMPSVPMSQDPATGKFVPGETPNATKRVREIEQKFRAEKEAEDRRVGYLYDERDRSNSDEFHRQYTSNDRLTFTPEEWDQYNEKKRQGLTPEDIEAGKVDGRVGWTQQITDQRQQKAPEAVLPSDNLAAVEQELTPEPMVKSKPKPLASASAYDDPTGTRFNQLIQSLAVKNGMTPEQARAIYQENTAKGLSPRQAMQPLIDMGQAAFKTGEANRMGNVARAAMLDPRNPRRESNAFGMMSPDDQQFAAASRFIKNPGISPRDVAQQKFDAEVRAKEALAARENELEKTRVLAQGPVNQAMWTAGGQVVGAGLGAIGNYFQTQAALQAAAQEQASRERAAEIAAKGVVDAAGKHNEPRPPTVEDKAKAEQMEVQTEGMKKSMDKMTEAEKYKQGDARHRVEGGTEAILRGAFRTAPAVAALQELAKQATNSNSKWGSDPGNKAESFDQSLKLLGLENEMLRKQLTEEYIGRPTTNPLGAGGGAV